MDIKMISKELTREEFKEKYNYSCMWLFGIGTERDSLQCKLRGSCVKCREEAIKNIKFKGEDNMEVNFIEMMKDSAENGTVYESSRGVEYKVANNTLYYKNDRGWRAFVGNLVYVTSLKFAKVEQYKEITVHQAIKDMQFKPVYYNSYDGNKKVMDCNTVMSMGLLVNTKFYIKE